MSFYISYKKVVSRLPNAYWDIHLGNGAKRPFRGQIGEFGVGKEFANWPFLPESPTQVPTNVG